MKFKLSTFENQILMNLKDEVQCGEVGEENKNGNELVQAAAIVEASFLLETEKLKEKKMSKIQWFTGLMVLLLQSLK